MTTHRASSLTPSPRDLSKRSSTLSWDSGVYVHMDLNNDDLEETNEPKENKQSPKVNPQAEEQSNNEEVAEDLYIIMSDLDPVICAAGGLKGSTSATVPKVHNRKALMPPSMLAVPPQPPPKRQQKSPTFEKKLGQSLETKPSNLLACQTSPVLRVKGNRQSLDVLPGEEPGYSCPKVEPKRSPQPSPRLPPRKPPRSKNSKRAETDEGRQKTKQEAEWREKTENVEDERKQEEQHLTERKEKTQEYEETSGAESHLGVGKPSPQILVVFADMEKGGEEGEGRGKDDEDPSNIGLTTPTMTEKSSLLSIKCSDLISDEDPDLAATSRNFTSTLPAKPEEIIPPKPHPRGSPKPPIKLPQLFSSMKAAAEEEKERRKQEGEQWRDNKDLVDKEGEGEDRKWTDRPSHVEETAMKSTLNHYDKRPRILKRFSHKPPCRNRPTAVITADDRSLHRESQHPEKLHQNKAKEQLQPPLPHTAQFTGTDSIMDTLQTDQELQIPVQTDPCQPRLHGSEDPQETAETLDGEAKQTTQKSDARGKVKQLAQNVLGRMKEGREGREGRSRASVEEIEMDGLRRDDIKLTQEEGGTEEEGGVYENAAVTEPQSHADLLKRRIKQKQATSGSPFSSFSLCTSVRLVEELLSGEEWSKFLCKDQGATPDPPGPPAPHTHSGDTARLSGSLQLNSGAGLDSGLRVFDGDPDDPEKDPVYEDIDVLNMMTEQEVQQEVTRAPGTAVPKILLENTSPATKDICTAVEFIQPANTSLNLSDIKSEGVLDSSVQKYLIKLGKKRRPRARWKMHRSKSREPHDRSLSSTSSQQVFSASIFYIVPASGGQEKQELSKGKIGGSSPTVLAKIKSALKGSQPKEDRGK